MISTMQRFIQAGFIVGLLAGGTAVAADAAKPAPAAVDNSGPSQLIESSANMLLSGIDAHRAEFRKDPTGLYALVESTLLPHFDTPYAAQLVLGLLGIFTCGVTSIASAIWGIIDGVMILTGSIATDAHGIPLRD